MAETECPNAELRIGKATIHIDSRLVRCPMTTSRPSFADRDDLSFFGFGLCDATSAPNHATLVSLKKFASTP